MNTKHDPKVIVALDYPDQQAALQFVNKVSPASCKLKVGLELFVSEGPDFVKKLSDVGFDIFLDLKFHDIPNTVAAASRSAAKLGVWMMNVHCLGGERMMRQAKIALADAVIDENTVPPLLIGVTILTSHEQTEINDIGLAGSVDTIVGNLTSQALRSGLDGIVCSPWEAAQLRKQFGDEVVLVTPGIRPSGSEKSDQRRVMTPAEAIRAGSSYLVIGRPITQSGDPASTLAEINEDIAEAGARFYAENA